MDRTVKSLVAAILLVGILLPVLSVEEASAVPAFARKYRMSCTTCHAPFPRLKPYGDDFAGNGFVLKDKDAPRYFVDTGDQNMDLIREFPVAVRFEGFIKHHTVTDRNVDFSMPYNLKLLSGGSLTKNVAYYFYFFFSERGEVAGIEDAYLMFNDLFGKDFDIYLGQFQVSDPLFKREVRLTYEDYLIYKTRIGDSKVNLAYDRGLMMTYGLPSGTDIIAEVINGNGIDPADGFRTYDDDKYKNFVGRISQDVHEHFRVGIFGYYGKEGAVNVNQITMGGVDASISFPKVELNVQFLERRDDNPFFAQTKPDEIKTRGGLAEIIHYPNGDKSRWYAAGLFNWIDSDVDAHDYQSVTAHAGHILRTNIRLIAEITYDLEYEESRAVVGFVSGF